MTRGSGRRRPCTGSEGRELVGYAGAYLDAARLARDAGGTGADHVATGNAVLAAIAASDAICCALLGERSRGADHRDAVTLLGSVRRGAPGDAAWARRLATALEQALDSKDASHYGVAGIGRDAQLRAVRAAEQLVSAAREVVSAG